MHKSLRPKKADRSSDISWRQRLQRSRVLELLIAVLFVVVLVYVVSLSIRVSRGVSRTLESPDHVVRLQILNGCGVNGLAARVADGLADYTDVDLVIKVVDTDNFDLSRVSETFVLSRLEDRSAATLLAQKLGLSADGITFKPLENNYRQVTATLVLGEDWPTLELLNRIVMEKK